MTAPGYRLEPCPFCGGRTERDWNYWFRHLDDGRMGQGVGIHCTSCDAYMTRCRAEFPGTPDEDLMAGLEQQWNSRDAVPQPEPPADLVERARVFWNTSPRHLGQIELMAAFAQEHAAELASAEIAANRDNVIEDAILDRDAAEAQAASEKARADKFKQQLDEATIRHSDARRREKAQRDRADKAEKALQQIADGKEVRRDDGTTEVVDLDDAAEIAEQALAASRDRKGGADE